MSITNIQDKPLLKDPRCPYCGRPVVRLGSVIGNEGVYHGECVRPPIIPSDIAPNYIPIVPYPVFPYPNYPYYIYPNYTLVYGNAKTTSDSTIKYKAMNEGSGC